MPYLSHPPIKLIIQALPVNEHSVEVEAEFWHPFFTHAQQLAIYEAIFAGRPMVRISRSWLRSDKLNLEVRAAGTIMWGYPRGARGARHTHWLINLAQIARAANTRDVCWSDYYHNLHAIGELGISTISKFAYAFTQKFQGHPALILDQRILAVLSSGRWSDLVGINNINYVTASTNYVDYLALLGGIADANNFSCEQLEFFLFMLGNSF
jgi:hypothetical protein